MKRDDQSASSRPATERRHTVRGRVTALGYLLTISAVLIIMLQLWSISRS